MKSIRLKKPATQRGKSAIGNLIVLALIGFGIWAGIQYIPQRLEAGTIRTILDRIQQRHNATPFRDDRDLQAVLGKQISVNDMTDMRDVFKVSWNQGRATINVSYERELNLIFTTRKMKYNERLVLQ